MKKKIDCQQRFRDYVKEYMENHDMNQKEFINLFGESEGTISTKLKGGNFTLDDVVNFYQEFEDVPPIEDILGLKKRVEDETFYGVIAPLLALMENDEYIDTLFEYTDDHTIKISFDFNGGLHTNADGLLDELQSMCEMGFHMDIAKYGIKHIKERSKKLLKCFDYASAETHKKHLLYDRLYEMYYAIETHDFSLCEKLRLDCTEDDLKKIESVLNLDSYTDKVNYLLQHGLIVCNCTENYWTRPLEYMYEPLPYIRSVTPPPNLDEK